MILPRRRKTSGRWPLIAATALAATGVFFAWTLFRRDKGANLTEDELREVEAFEENERRKRGSR